MAGGWFLKNKPLFAGMFHTRNLEHALFPGRGLHRSFSAHIIHIGKKKRMLKRILVTEDDPAIAELLLLLLEMEGYAVEIQRDGYAVQTMHEPFPDLLVMDIRLPGTDGRTICRQVKDQKTTRHVPIILISAQQESGATAMEAGANGFLAKPFEIQEMLDLIAQTLAQV